MGDDLDKLTGAGENHVTVEEYFEDLVDSKGRNNARGPSSRGREILNFLFTFLVSLAIILLVRQFILQNNTVVGSSMVPTLEDGDQILVEKVSSYFPSVIRRGDIVTVNTRGHQTFSRDERYIIKRIIALPGEEVRIQDGRVLVDGLILVESYLPEDLETVCRNPAYADLVLASDEYYVMGDNRPHSIDSRSIGPVKQSDLVGRLFFRFYPLNKLGKPK